MNEFTEISNVLWGSKIRFELDGEILTGLNYVAKGLHKVYVFDRRSERTVELPSNKEVEVLKRGGFHAETDFLIR